MSTPTWVIFYATFLFLIGGCGLFNNIQNAKEKKTNTFAENIKNHKGKIENDSLAKFNAVMDTMSLAKQDSIKEGLSKIFGKDGIILDENMELDLKATFEKTANISDFRKVWTIRFGRIGILFSLTFIIGAIFLLTKNKFTIPFIFTILIASLTFGILQYIIYNSDAESGSFINAASTFKIVFGIVIDIILLIVFKVNDKSYFGKDKYKESIITS